MRGSNGYKAEDRVKLMKLLWDTLGTEFGTSDESGFRDEGSTEYVQGPVAVLIHPRVTSPPTPPPEEII